VQDSVGLLLNDSYDAISFEIDPSIEAIKPVRAHRITLLQVFNNILINAVESIHRAGTVPGKISIRAENDEMDGVDIVHVQISDNGKGIERDNLSRIFERGFSTKDNVLSSFGLHWCANTIATMRGQIYAESQGNGRGACFHILLPSSHQTISTFDAKTKVRS